MFELALLRRQEELTPYPNFRWFYVAGDAHTFINQGRFYTSSDTSQTLPAWVGTLISP